MSTDNGNNSDHAVVIGASIGGLLAARVLSDHFAHVTVIDRDELPVEAATRRAVPQGKHTHVLLSRGSEIMESLFPGLTRGVTAAGAPLGDVGTRLRIYNDGYLMRRGGPAGMNMLFASRPLIEHEVRTRVAAIPHAEIHTNRHVVGLETTTGGGTVTGIRVSGTGERGPEETIEANLVVDASGRSSRSPAWLEDLGFAPPPEEEVRARIGYATRLYRRRPEDFDGDLVVLVSPVPGTPRGGLACANEGDRWTVTLVGYANDHPPTDPAGFAAFAASLVKPDLAEAITRMEPLTDIMSYRFQSSLRRRYERLRRFPDGYLVFGDALCSFNPIFGQGMTVAAIEAEALDRCLGRGRHGLARRFFRHAATAIDNPWDIVVGSDLRFPEVEGRRTFQVRLSNAYLSRLVRAAATDVPTGEAFKRVLSLYDPPQRLLRPSVAGRVLWANLAHRHRPEAGEPSATPVAATTHGS
jgi:2-polyprenyl-6-methoxyphenol hydroxylase-like FAD-dependent oxidoreductase